MIAQWCVPVTTATAPAPIAFSIKSRPSLGASYGKKMSPALTRMGRRKTGTGIDPTLAGISIKS